MDYVVEREMSSHKESVMKKGGLNPQAISKVAKVISKPLPKK
jgi:hypothetical protein